MSSMWATVIGGLLGSVAFAIIVRTLARNQDKSPPHVENKQVTIGDFAQPNDWKPDAS